MKTIRTFGLLLLCCASATAGPIDRKTFALTLPAGWTENTQDDMYNADFVVFFEKGELALFTVLIGEKTAGAAAEPMVRNQESQWRNRLTDLKFTDFKNWSRYKGKGVELEGLMQDVVRVRARVFGFESERYACVIIESAGVRDWSKVESEFAQIRKSFRLK